MTRIPVILLAAGALLLLAGCGEQRQADAPRVQSDLLATRRQVPLPNQTGPDRPLGTNPFSLSWDLQFPSPVHSSWIGPQIPELMFFQLENREIHAVEVYSGMTRWATPPLPRLIDLPPFVARLVIPAADAKKRNLNDDRLYVISGDLLFCYDAQFGELIWRLQLSEEGLYGFEPCSGPYATGMGKNLRVFIGDWEGRARVITFSEERGRPYVLWQWNLQNPPTCTAEGSDEFTYVADQGGKLSCFTLERNLSWQFDCLAPIFGSPLTRGTRLYVGDDNGVLHVLNRLSGRELNKQFLQARLRRQPMAFKAEPQRIYVWADLGGNNGGLHAITTQADSIPLENASVTIKTEGNTPIGGDAKLVETERLQPDWMVAGINRLVCSSPAHLFVMPPHGTRVYALNRKTGNFDWNFDLEQVGDRDEKAGVPQRRIVHITQYLDPTDTIRSIITSDANGRVIAYRLFGQYR